MAWVSVGQRTFGVSVEPVPPKPTPQKPVNPIQSWSVSITPRSAHPHERVTVHIVTKSRIPRPHIKATVSLFGQTKTVEGYGAVNVTFTAPEVRTKKTAVGLAKLEVEVGPTPV